ncbi:hypothetical protein D5F01_LYC09037 [Larimichthys crocea]|uniref:Uncharacterized protein n=1 Tax=Larimichthys crocea TaxID=215358 RepID=A0A6G0IJS4_LARCR|nr:hypothetical protein D5F01_LYC09037 [Larimichthys crocea]
MLGHLTISTDQKRICQGTAIVFWMILDTANIFYPPLKIAGTLCEALIIIGVLSHVAYLTMGLQERGRRRWLIKLVAATLWCLETQTEWMVWCWEDRAGEIAEFEPMAVDNSVAEDNSDTGPEPPQQPPSIPTTPPEEPPTLQMEDPVSKAYQEVKEQADARVTAILTQGDLSDRATPAAEVEAETPCMDELPGRVASPR